MNHLLNRMKAIHFIFTCLLATLAACAQVEPQSGINVWANRQIPPFEGPRSSANDSYTPPRLLSGKAPVYPATRILKGVDGKATISYTISEDGTTRDFVVISATYRYFGIHAVLAVKEWRYQPALKAGIPVPVRITQSFDFSLLP